MTLLILSFLAGVLTVAAPCILPLLPVIIGGSLVNNDSNKRAKLARPVIVTASLAVSVILFTLLLKATTTLLGVPQQVWQIISATIVVLLGINFLYPRLWEEISLRTNLYMSSNKVLGSSTKKSGTKGAILTGFALGPVFNSCSPTYALIVASILPASFGIGLLYLLSYAAGLSLALLLITYIGQGFIEKLGWLANPKGWFIKTLGIVFIIVGIGILFGIDKKLQTYVLEQGWYDPVKNLEERFR